MKKAILTFIISVQFFIAFAQSTSQLDMKYGLNKFKFNTSPTLYNTLLEQKVTTYSSSNVKSYSYVGNDLREIFGTSIDTISLTYYKGKLFSISINFIPDVFSQSDYQKVLYSIKQAYGEGSPIKISDSDLSGYGRKWTGKKATLELIYVQMGSGTFKTSGGYITAIEPNIQRQILLDEL